MSTNNNPAEVFSRPNQEAKIHDFEHYSLWTNVKNRPGFRARMSFGERNGAFRVSVFTGAEEGPKVIYVGMSPTVFKLFVQKFKAVIKGEPGTKDKVDNMDRDPSTTPEESKSGNIAKVLRNTLHFGKDADGVVWIGIEQANVDKITFKILSSAWHHFYKADGSKITPEEGSSAEALALIECLDISMNNFIGRIRPPFEKTAGKGRGEKSDFSKSAGGSLNSFGADEDVSF